jgi:L-alanine-DL-glutamate epimerase-like enolase superfamily enzyme
MSTEATIRSGTVRAYTIPTDSPEADGTIAWNSTTLIVVELHAGNETGIGYTYAHSTAAVVARELIDKHCVHRSALDINALFTAMRISQRNYGAEGIGATALSAVDIALWDLKAKLLNQPLACLLGPIRKAAPVYGSGGFTTYTDEQLCAQLSGWISQGIPRVKMKVGTHPDQDPQRIAVARKAIGDEAELFIDANGAYSRKQALHFAQLAHAEYNVTWFEEPVSSDDLAGLHLLRNRAPAGMDIAAGEYGWSAMYLRKMIAAEAVDAIQADATRCGGVTGFMDAAAIADAPQPSTCISAALPGLCATSSTFTTTSASSPCSSTASAQPKTMAVCTPTSPVPDSASNSSKGMRNPSQRRFSIERLHDLRPRPATLQSCPAVPRPAAELS